MFRRPSGMRTWFAIASLACASVAVGQTDTTSATTVPATAAPAAPVPSTTPPPVSPLMGLLDSAGVGKPLRNAGIQILGHVEGSWTYAASAPPENIITGRAFDFENENILLNQLYLVVQRDVTVSPTNWDVGGRMDWMYGADARLIHSNGLFDWNGAPTSIGGPGGPENQFDLTQLFVDAAVPVGNGLRIRAGKFVTLEGKETIDPTTTPLYSRSFLFNYAEPLTQTGVYATYSFNDQWQLDAGFSRGWNQSLEDNNGAIDGFGRVTYHTPDKKNDIYLSTIIGPQNADNNSDYRYNFDLVWDYHLSDQVTLSLNGDYNYDGINNGEQWYGLAGYVTWGVNDYLTVVSRLEWFNDGDDFNGLGTNVYDIAAGLLITPFPHDSLGANWKIRPEVRLDYAENAIWDGDTNHYQFTAAIESYFTF